MSVQTYEELLADAHAIGTPLWWLVTLEQRLVQRQQGMLRTDRYYSGQHDLPFLTEAHEAKMEDEFAQLLRESSSNFMRLVVDATEERLAVEGFRLSAQTDATADNDTWGIWQANDMDLQSSTAFLDALIKGVSYIGVWSDEDGDNYPDLCVEDPLETIVAYEAGSNYRRRACALKVWLDENRGVRRANVYLPEGIYKFEASANVAAGREASTEEKIQVPWTAMEDDFAANPLGVVPIIPLRNRPRLLIEGESEISDVIHVQNQINGFLFLLALAGYFGAHRQRWAVGLKIMRDKNNKPIEPFDVAVDRILALDDPEAKFGEFSETPLDGYIKAIEQKVLHIAVTTRTPRHYLFQEGQSPSGDAINSAESGLVRKVLRKQRPFGEGLEEALRLARRFKGEGETPPDSEIVWADPQTHTPGTVTDAVMKQYVGRLIPKAVALELLGYSQTRIRQILDTADEEFAPITILQNAEQAAQQSDVTRAVPSGA